MRSTVDLVAELRSGTTVLPCVRAGGLCAVRQTAAGTVHLIGTAAGPLGGDEVVVRVAVGPGAALVIRSAAASIVLPGRSEPASRLTLDVSVADGGHLDVALEPTVVCTGAVHDTRTAATLHGSARLRLREQVVLGRDGELPGRWSGRTHVVRDGVALLRHSLTSAHLGPDGAGHRVLVSEVTTATADRPAVSGGAVVMPLASGGTLATSTATDLVTAGGDLDRAWAAVPAPLVAD